MSNVLLQSRRILHVNGLAEQVTEVTLRAAFIPFGPIKSIEMPRDYTKNAHKGFGFVEFDDSDDAAEAVDNMDGSDLFGKTINVSIAQPSQLSKTGNSSAGFTTTAVWSTDEWFQQNSGIETEEQQAQLQMKQRDEAQLQEQVAMP